MADETTVSVGKNWSATTEQSTSQTTQNSTTKPVLDQKMLQTILAGLKGFMTDEEIDAYAENLLRPQLNAELEAAQQVRDATVLGLEQEIENIAATLARSILEQQSANAQSKAGIETAALARGMGRSSYTLQTLANQDNVLAKVIQELTEESARNQAQKQAQITLAEQQNAQTQGRLNTDYAKNLAAKIQELRESQRKEYNQNYLTAVSGAMGSQTHGTSTTTSSGTSQTVQGVFENNSNNNSSSAPTTVARPTFSTTVTV